MALIDPAVLPVVSTFLFVFAIVFGLLSYSGVGNFSKRINAVIALAIAIFSTLYEPLVAGLQELIPFATILLIILFFIVFIKKIVGGNNTDAFPVIATIALLLLVLMVVGDRLAPFLPAGTDTTGALWAIGIIAVLMFFYAIYKQK